MIASKFTSITLNPYSALKVASEDSPSSSGTSGTKGNYVLVAGTVTSPWQQFSGVYLSMDLGHGDQENQWGRERDLIWGTSTCHWVTKIHTTCSDRWEHPHKNKSMHFLWKNLLSPPTPPAKVGRLSLRGGNNLWFILFLCWLIIELP